MFEGYNDVLLVEEACELLCIGRNNMYKLLASGELRAFKNGREWRIPKKAVEEYIMTAACLNKKH